MKATRKNLNALGIIKGKILDLMSFGDEVGYFKKVGTQRVQDMTCELNKDQFLDAYNEYVNDFRALNLKDYKPLDNYFDYIYILKIWKHRHNGNYSCYIFNEDTKEIHQRVIKQIKNRDNNYFIKNGGEFIEVILGNYEINRI